VKQETGLLLMGYFLDMPFDLEDGSSEFLRNVGELIPYYTTSRPRR
jgi:hypothetical protein